MILLNGIYFISFIWISCFRSTVSRVYGCGLVCDVRIVGGEEAMPGQNPWMAILFPKANPGSLVDLEYRTDHVACGGSLISKRHVLSAAHCFDGLNSPNDYMVRLGAHDIFATPKQGEDFFPEMIAVHDGFDMENLKDDIALITLDRDVEYSTMIRPICLPFDFTNEDFLDQTATVAGFGLTSDKEYGQGSPVLRKVDVKVVSTSRCSQAFQGTNVLIDQRSICAGFEEGHKDSCQGDSGGPLMLRNKKDKRWYLIGVVSVGYKCAVPGFFGIYTRTTEYLGWIEQHTNYAEERKK